MPKNRFAEVRYRVLDECLRDKLHYYTLEELGQKCDEAIFQIDEIERPPISLKQIRNDLKFMESEAGYKAEIESIKMTGSKKHYFRYADLGFSINKKPLTEEDLQNLKSSVYILQRFGGLHNEDWINEFAARIESLPEKKEEKVSPKIEIILFEHQDIDGGGEWIITLYKAIEKKHCLSITYREFGAEQDKVYQVSPYLLKQYNRRWFLLCKSEALDQITTLPLDRIKDVQPSNLSFSFYPDNNPAEFFEDVIGVINKKEDPVEKIVLEVHRELLPYVESKLLHESQKKSKPTADPDWFTVELQVKPNYEFYSVILSHGRKMRVVSPSRVKAKIKSFIKQMASYY
ncbi:helix-turn-helix transcriptional regulator [Pleomorphovibrio marinus]|uniref:helix-turn-helix transcriptional regulator n=1 Tax=Pleomorphovibrio marinus TaxID=2164132 RepID=UPI000E0A943C|nr:WYL domain-containing protein [Pleomorphovibrio marinus]